MIITFFFFFSSRRRHTRFSRDWSSDVCSSDLRWAISKADRRHVDEGSHGEDGHLDAASAQNARCPHTLRSLLGLNGRTPQSPWGDDPMILRRHTQWKRWALDWRPRVSRVGTSSVDFYKVSNGRRWRGAGTA